MPQGKGTYGSKVGRPKSKLKINKKKRYNPYGKGSNMNPSKASRTTGP